MSDASSSAKGAHDFGPWEEKNRWWTTRWCRTCGFEQWIGTSFFKFFGSADGADLYLFRETREGRCPP